MDIEKLKPIVEVLIFAGDEPVPVKQMVTLIEDTTEKQVLKAIDALNHEYGQNNRTMTIIKIAGGYQMVSREKYSPWIRKLFQRKIKSRLSQAALEALSVIAFKQPVSRVDVDAIRGVNSDGVIKTLLERRLITMCGRAEGPGRPLLYKTTKEFLKHFGINQLSDLPRPKELEEMFKEENLPQDLIPPEESRNQDTSEGHGETKSDNKEKSEDKSTEKAVLSKEPEQEKSGTDNTPAQGEKQPPSHEKSS